MTYPTYPVALPPKQPGRYGNRPTPRAFVFASDPQYPWTPASDYGEYESDADRNKASQALINEQYASIANYRDSLGGTGIPVMINGDMTAYGHGWQRKVLYPIIERHLQENYYFGLGNHDYRNNVTDESGGSFNNGGPRDSVMDLLNHHRGVVDTMDIATSSSYRLTTYRGSLAYSISFGQVRLIQLNNEPTYRVDFDSGWAWPFEPRDKFRISDALGWLQKQLKEAYENGQIILLNLHQPDDWDGTEEDLMHFRDMINHFQVNAVFGGHYHREAGGWHRSNRQYGVVPVFLSGSASQRTYLLAELDNDAQGLTVKCVRNNDWTQAETLRHLRLYRA
ncbi:MAG: metallophosphoesterase [Pseudomonas putida]|jgi:cytolysin (calcineurin-like family phosphatase)|nr:metallophosphoesterase [Pseudomonas putida]